MKKGELLTITRASEVLGVHSRTLRHWADEGHLPHVKTPGGHRRFFRKDLEQFIGHMGKRAGDQNLTRGTRKAIREAINEKPTGPPPSHARLPIDLTDAQRQEMRSIGRLLVSLVIRYASGEMEEGILEQAREIGTSYGRLCRRTGMSVSTTIATFNFYRNPILEVTLESVAKTGNLDVSRPQLYRRLDRFFNEVLMATVSAAESSDT